MSNTRSVAVSGEQTGALVVAPKSTALKINSIDELERMGKLVATSNLFGLASKGDAPETVAAKGVVVAALCQQEGISFMEFMRKYHFVNGRVDMRTDAMLAEFQRLGGAYTIQQSDAEGAIATFSYHGTTFQEKVIWAELCKNPEPPFFEQVGANKWAVRDNYAYPRKRSQMLWARCVSNGIRKVCPLVNMGVYTPEETVEFDPVPVQAVPVQPETPTPEAAPEAGEGVAAEPAPAPKRRSRKAKPAPEEAEVVDVAPAETPAPESPVIPFPTDATEDPEKFATCPCEGKVKGRRWDDLPTDYLRRVVDAYDDPNMDRAVFAGMVDEHADYIRAVIAQRAEQEEK